MLFAILDGKSRNTRCLILVFSVFVPEKQLAAADSENESCFGENVLAFPS